MTYNYLLFDLPSDHEVEGVLSTECDVIRAILANNGEGRNVKVIKATTSEALCHKSPQQPYGQIKIVHVACHARDNGAACKILIDSERRKNTQASSDVGARQLARF